MRKGVRRGHFRDPAGGPGPLAHQFSLQLGHVFPSASAEQRATLMANFTALGLLYVLLGEGADLDDWLGLTIPILEGSERTLVALDADLLSTTVSARTGAAYRLARTALDPSAFPARAESFI